MILVTIINNINDNEVLYEYNNEDLDIYNDLIADLEIKSENIKEIDYYLIKDDSHINLETIKNQKIEQENFKIFLKLTFVDELPDIDLGEKL